MFSDPIFIEAPSEKRTSPFHQKVGNKNLALLSRMLVLGHKKHVVHTENIVNSSTPNYRYRNYSFESQLQEAMREGTADAYLNISGEISHPNDTVVRHNGNNVDVEFESQKMGENQKFQKLLVEIYNDHSRLIDMAIGAH